MKFLILIALMSASAFATEPLKSEKLKQKICSGMSYEVEDVNDNFYDVQETCMKGSFNVVNKQYNEALKTVLYLKVEVAFAASEYAVTGTAELFKNITATASGQIKTSWKYQISDFDLEDKRGMEGILEDLLDWENVNYHNGDGGFSKKTISYQEALKNLNSDLEESEDCQYYTVEDSRSALYHLQDHSEEVYEFIKGQIKKDNIEYILHRGFDDGESEYCSYYYFSIMTKDGYFIYLDFDFTT
jgi:hypothetical protein